MVAPLLAYAGLHVPQVSVLVDCEDVPDSTPDPAGQENEHAAAPTEEYEPDGHARQ